MSNFDKLLEEELEKQRKKKEEEEKKKKQKQQTKGKTKQQTQSSMISDRKLSYLPSYTALGSNNAVSKNIGRVESSLDEFLKREKSATDVSTTRNMGGGSFEEKEEAKWFKGGGYSDGFDWYDVPLTMLGTIGDAGRHILKGAVGMIEGIGDAIMYDAAIRADYLDILSKKYDFLETPDSWEFDGKKVDWSDISVSAKHVGQQDLTTSILGGSGDWLDQYSFLGKYPDAVMEGIGQVALMWATGGAASAAGIGASGVTALTTGMTAVSGVGSGMSEAYQSGATDEEAAQYGLIAGTADAVTELIFGGMGKGINAMGYAKGLTSADDIIAKTVSKKISNTIAKNAVELGIKAGAEGAEEVMAGLVQAVGKKMTYMSEEELSQIIADENLLEQFIVGAMTSSIAQSPDLVQSNKAGKDFITGNTKNDQAVVDRVVKDRIAEMEAEGKTVTAKDKAAIKAEVQEDLERGYISTDTIEEMLGGDKFTAYQDTIKQENDALAELAELYEGDELKQKTEEFLANSKRSEAAKALRESVFDTVKDSKLGESYLERARRGERFTADLTKYDEKQRAVVQKAIDSGVLNNTNRTRDMVDWIAKVSADTGVSFDFTNNEKLKNSIFAVNGKTVDGYITKDGVVLNVNSKKYINTVVGHEITHVLEGTKLYDALESAVFEYAKANGTYKDAMKAAYDMYHDVDGYKGAEGLKAIKKEAVANMVGDYLFTDKKFISHLSAKNPNIFRKVWNEIKYMVKVARAGSDEAKKLLQVQKAFEEAYREATQKAGKAEQSQEQKNTAEDGGVKYRIRKDIVDVNGKEYDIVVELDKTVSKSTLSNPQRFMGYIENNLVGLQIPVADSEGNIEIIEFARPNETTTKDGKRHPVLGKLAYTSGDARKQVIVNAKEVVEESLYDPVYSSNSNEHGWLDQNGWESRKTYVLAQDGNLYEAYLRIAKARDGRNILYTVNLDVKNGIAVDWSATQNRATVLAAMPSGESVAQKDPNVKYSLSEDAAGNELTEAQQEYFKDSKARDDQGRLLVLYHQTDGDFTIFDTRHPGAGSRDSDTPFGIFMKRTAGDIGLSGKKQMALYANITNPLRAMNREDLIRQLRDISANYADISDKHKRLDSEYHDKFEQAKNAWRDYIIEWRASNPDAKRSTLYDDPKFNELFEAEDAVIEEWTAAADRLSTQAKEAITEDLRKAGYDGIFLENDVGSWGRKTDAIIALDAEQVKNIDNEKPTADPDIRRSLSNEDALPIKQGNYRVAGEEVAYEAPMPMADSRTGTEAETEVAEAMTGEADLLPMGKQLEERLRESQKAKAEKDLKNMRALRDLQLADFDSRIAEKEAEFEAMPHKYSAAAKELQKEIEQLKKNRTTAEKNYEYWIENAGARFENITKEAEIASSPTEAEATEETAANGVASRSELHERIVGDIKGEFVKRGFDFDTVLKKANNLSTFATVDNTPQRVMEKALGYKEGGILSDLTVNKVAQNETEGIKWLNSFTDRKHGLLKQISKQYGIKPGSKESAAAQMYAEGFYVNEKDEIIRYGDPELIQDFPDANVRRNIKGLARDPRIRQIYDETLAKINESRTRNAYPEIPRLDNYFLHFRAMEDTFSRLGLPFNPNDIKAKDLPTDLNGVTADLKPGQPYFASAMHRKGKRTSFDLLGGLERYLNSAKNQIYHIDDIQTLRALRNYIAETYGQANGLENLDSLSEEDAQERIKEVYDAHLSTFAKFLNEEANVLAGKTALIDRGLEGIIGRRGITFLNTVNQQVGKNMVGFNVSSSLTNFLAPVQAFAKANKFDFVKALAQTAANRVGSIFGRNDGFADNSPVMIRRKGADSFHRTLWQKAGDAGYVLMSAVDNISTELIARAKYNELTRKGMDSQTAHIETDKWVSRLMGDRSLGQQPQLYNSKMLGIVTKFQLEVRNQLDSQFYDTIQEAKVSTEHIQNGLERNAKKAAKIASTFFQLAVAQHLFGKAFESIAGYNPAFDIISVITKMFGWDDEEDDEDTVLDNIEEGFFELLDDLPYTSTLTGGRIPISSALPVEEFINGEDQYGNEKSRWETLGEALPYYLLPGGYGQIKKTTQGLGLFDDDLPISGSYTDSGNLRFPVEDTPWNRIQAGLFGQYASENARDYFDNERSPLKPKQTQEFIDSELPIRDYWDYREGLSGLDSLDEKGDYIGGLDLPISTKNLFINNIAGREELIDMTNYSKYANFSEFDWAEQNKKKYAFLQEHGMSYADYESLDEDSKKAYSWAFNNPEKYAFIKGFGLSATDYYSLDEDSKDAYSWAFNNPEKYAFIKGFGLSATDYYSLDEDSKDAYSWAYNNPESYTFSKSVTDDVVKYRQYDRELNAIKADKDRNGKTISGSRKDKVFDYIMGLDIDAGAKAILFKSEYPSEDIDNEFIIDYLNKRKDISTDEKVVILKKLGFKVDSRGNVTW